MSKPNKVYGGIEWTPANIVTVIRILFIPVFVIALLASWEQCLFGTDPMGLTVRAVVSLVVFGLICLTDTLDGYLARSRNEVTVFGKFIDPIADKILVVAALLCLVQLGLLSSWVPIVIVAREMLVSGLRMLVASAGVVVSASILGKIKTATTMVAICLFILMVSPIVAALTWFRVLAWALMLVAVFFTIASMVDYFAKAWPLLAAAPAKAEGEEKAEKTSNELAFAWGTVEGDHPLAREVLAGLTEKGLSVCTAESCTGGLVCAALTSQPGSSSVVRGGAVTYTVDEKVRALGLDPDQVERDGVVSEETARAMALGAKKRLGADYALSTTGVAGPGGATPQAPLGCVCLGLACPDGTVTSQRCIFEGSRAQVRAQAVDKALEMLMEHMSKDAS
mgnify:FL=1